MARIRTIKPEYWADEKLSPMDDSTRLLFLALISMADDCGRLLDSVPQIVAFLHPYLDDVAFANRSRGIRESLAKLSEAGRIVRGMTASGQRVVQIANWEKHQRVDHPNTRAALPEIVEVTPLTEIRETLARDSRDIRESLATDSRDDLRPTTYDQRPTTSEQERVARKRAPRPKLVVSPDEAEFARRWNAEIGRTTEADVHKLLGTYLATHGLEAVWAGAKDFKAARRIRVKLPWFAENCVAWIDLAKQPWNNDRGEPTARYRIVVEGKAA